MDDEEFRRRAHALVDWMADYLRDVPSRRVVPDVRPGDVRAALPAVPAEAGEPFDRLLEEFERVIVPAMTHWNHPGWFAYFPANTSPPSILAEMAVSAIGAQCMSWQTSPAATELEQQAMDWLRQLLGLPAAFRGVIQDTASTATLSALLAARERATGHRAGREGLAATGARLAVYASEERHSSVDKAVKLAGYGTEALRLVPTDAAYGLDPAALAARLAEDRAAGVTPAAIVATVGTTSSTGVDPLPAVAALARAHGAWLHVDAAYAGAVALLPECAPLVAGLGEADSVVMNPHKWLLVNFDCSALFVRDAALPDYLATFSLTPEYLRTAHDAEVANFRDWGIQLGRRFRALKLWWVLRSYGAEGLRAMLRRHLALAVEFGGWVAADPRFELLAPVRLGLVCFRLRPRAGEPAEATDARTEALLRAVNADGRVHLTHTRLRGRYTIRLAVGQRTTAREHVALAWALVRAAADAGA